MNQIGLITDFGTADWYTGVMRSVINRINPQSSIIDISHDVPPQDILSGAFVLWNSFDHFPVGSVFVVVVDPGVGSGRDIIAVETKKYKFIAPDNGVLDLISDKTGILRCHKVENKKYFLKEVSSTFHGRDIFAPVGAHLSKDLPLEKLGPEVSFVPKLTVSFETVKEPGRYQGKVIYADKFGNLITNLKLKITDYNGIEVRSLTDTPVELKGSYSEVREGKALAVKGSSGLLEISCRNSSAEKMLGKGPGSELIVRVKE